MTLSIETILQGTGLGPTQSVGLMQVIPLLADDDGVALAPPSLEVGTQGYGTLLLRADADTLVPTGAGWIVRQRAQDHALGSATFVKKGEQKVIPTATCIQQTQGGTITQGTHPLTILPAMLRKAALAVRHVVDFRKLWESIGALNAAHGVGGVGGNLVAFLQKFEQELDAFVAELEIVDRQVGAIVLVAGEVVGIERTPSAAYFRAVFGPLVRVCYGSLAVAAAKENREVPPTRVPLVLAEQTLAGLRAALAVAREREEAIANLVAARLRSEPLVPAETPDEVLGDAEIRTVAGPRFAGQVVTVRGRVAYASLCA